MSERFWHILKVLLCVLGVVGGISGGASFHFIYNNNAASLWAAASVGLLFIYLAQELLKHNNLLHKCHTHASLLVCQVVTTVLALACVVLTILHIIVAYLGEEALDNMEFNDYIVGVWTFYCFKCALGLSVSSHKCRKRLRQLEGVLQRPESPNFLRGRPQVPYQQLDSSALESSHLRTRRRQQPFSEDESVVIDGDTVSVDEGPVVRDALSVTSNGESAIDMDLVAGEIDAGAHSFGNSRLVVT